MCGRYALYDINETPEAFEERFGVAPTALDDFPKSYNIGPFRDVPVILQLQNALPEIKLAYWQLIPSFAKTEKSKYNMFNTRNDSFDTKPFWQKLLMNQRCLFLFNHFYEWQKVGKDKKPYLFSNTENDLMAVGGIYSIWQNPESGEKKLSASMITVDANEIVKPIHARMPLILPKESEKLWLDNTFKNAAALQSLLKPLDAKFLQKKPVSSKVNNIRNDGAALIHNDE